MQAMKTTTIDAVKVDAVKVNAVKVNAMQGQVHCPMCTHTVAANVLLLKKTARVVPGQKCPRCSGALDAAFVLEVPEAA